MAATDFSEGLRNHDAGACIAADKLVPVIEPSVDRVDLENESRA